jgi:hypothetical protein
MGQALLGLGLGLAALAGAQAAPLRLSLDAMAAAGPTGELADPLLANAAADDPVGDGDGGGDGELSFVAAPDLPFPEAADVAATVDADWLVAARSQQDDTVAADRRLGEFAPAAPPPLLVSTDPLDGVTVAAASPASGEDPEPALQLPAKPPDRSALVWMVVPTITLALAVAWWTGRSGRHRHKRSATR